MRPDALRLKESIAVVRQLAEAAVSREPQCQAPVSGHHMPERVNDFDTAGFGI